MNAPERWKSIPGYEGFYQASNLGRIRRNCRQVIDALQRKYPARTRPLRQFRRAHGYQAVVLSRENTKREFLVHRLVLMAFCGRPAQGIECNHVDGDKSNNNVKNLEWVTSSENKIHAFRTGLLKPPSRDLRGARNPNTELTWEKVRQIRDMVSKGYEQKTVAKHFGVSNATISKIWVGRTWREQ